jgi:hypothetical protein
MCQRATLHAWFDIKVAAQLRRPLIGSAVELMKLVIRFLKIIFLIGTHGLAVAGVFFSVEVASSGNVGFAIAFGAMAGVIILDLIAWWSFMNAAPARRHQIGNVVYWCGCISALLFAVSGAFFAVSWGVFHNPYWVFVVLTVTAVFWLPAFVCWRVGRAFLYFLVGR